MAIDVEDIANRIEPIIDAAKAAGSKILELFTPDITVTHKTDDTPLTVADIAANQVVIEKLTSIAPDLPVLTEESCDVPYSTRDTWSTYWLVDPLDGTGEFINHNGEFSVNIALIHHGRPVLGVVHAPVLNITYWACHGGGAWKQAGNNPARKIEVRLAPAKRVTVARSWAPVRGAELQTFLENVGEHKVIHMGGALKSCLVAEGRADIYPCLGPTGEWDTGAAQCIVEEAGGRITDTNMQELRYNTKESLINPHFFVFGKGTHDWSDYLKQE